MFWKENSLSYEQQTRYRYSPWHWPPLAVLREWDQTDMVQWLWKVFFCQSVCLCSMGKWLELSASVSVDIYLVHGKTLVCYNREFKRSKVKVRSCMLARLLWFPMLWCHVSSVVRVAAIQHCVYGSVDVTRCFTYLLTYWLIDWLQCTAMTWSET